MLLFRVSTAKNLSIILIYKRLNDFGASWVISGKESTCPCRRHRFDP